MLDAINWLKESNLSLKRKTIATTTILTKKAHLPLVRNNIIKAA